MKDQLLLLNTNITGDSARSSNDTYVYIIPDYDIRWVYSIREKVSKLYGSVRTAITTVHVHISDSISFVALSSNYILLNAQEELSFVHSNGKFTQISQNLRMLNVPNVLSFKYWMLYRNALSVWSTSKKTSYYMKHYLQLKPSSWVPWVFPSSKLDIKINIVICLDIICTNDEVVRNLSQLGLNVTGSSMKIVDNRRVEIINISIHSTVVVLHVTHTSNSSDHSELYDGLMNLIVHSRLVYYRERHSSVNRSIILAFLESQGIQLIPYTIPASQTIFSFVYSVIQSSIGGDKMSYGNKQPSVLSAHIHYRNANPFVLNLANSSRNTHCRYFKPTPFIPLNITDLKYGNIHLPFVEFKPQVRDFGYVTFIDQ